MNINMENVSDQELFSELFENPINPLLLHMVPPFVDVNSPMYYLQLNGEVIYNWRQVHGRPQTVFDLLQRSILPLGYQLKASGQERIGNALAESIRRFWRKVQGTKDGKKRKRLKAETWVKLAIKPEEIERTPFDVLAETRNVEEKTASLYEEMRQELAYRGKDFTDVGKKQHYQAKI